MPFVKGKSGNPSGRKKATAQSIAYADSCKALLPPAVKLLERLIKSPHDLSPTEILRINEHLADRVYGKPATSMQVTGADNGPLVVQWLPADSKVGQ